MVADGRLIPVRVGDIEVEVETVPVAGTEQTSGRAERALEHAQDAFRAGIPPDVPELIASRHYFPS